MTSEIAEYITAQTPEIRPRLVAVYQTIRAALPDAAERISYKMPTFWQGRNLIHFAVFKAHIGLFPGGRATAVFADRLTEYKTGKGGVRLPNDRPLPLELIAEIATWCGAAHAEPQAQGRMKNE